MQEYKVMEFNTTDFQDYFGNTWCNVAFEGVSEPVKWIVKDPTKVKIDQRVYGEITDETSKANKPYRRFRSKPRPEGVENAPQQQTDEYWAERNNTIRAQWAIGQSMVWQTTKGKHELVNVEEIEVLAKELFTMVDRVSSPEEVDPNEVDIVNLNDVPL